MKNKPAVLRFMGSFLTELLLFCAIWMLVGPRIIDPNTLPAAKLCNGGNPRFVFLFYGIALYAGCRIILFCIRKIAKTRRSNL